MGSLLALIFLVLLLAGTVISSLATQYTIYLVALLLAGFITGIATNISYRYQKILALFIALFITMGLITLLTYLFNKYHGYCDLFCALDYPVFLIAVLCLFMLALVVGAFTAHFLRMHRLRK
jgi:hypothetical protein